MKRRMIAVSLILALVLTFAPDIPAQKANAAGITISVQTKDAEAGNTVSLEVSISGNTGVAVMQLPVSYDTNKLEYQSFKGNTLGGEGWTYGTSAVWVAAEDYTGNGTLFTLTFKVKAGATGFATVSVGKGTVANFSETILSVTYISGGVNIEKKTEPSTEPTTESEEETETETEEESSEESSKESSEESSTEASTTEPTSKEKESSKGADETETTEETEQESSEESEESTEEVSEESEESEESTETATTETEETVKEILKSGEKQEKNMGNGKLVISLPEPEEEGAELSLEFTDDLQEALLTEEEKKRVEEGETAEINISADWISEDEMSVENHDALEDALEKLQSEGNTTKLISALNLGVTKQIGNDDAVTLSEEELAKALKEGNGSLSLDVSELKKSVEKDEDLYVLLMESDGSTKLEKLSETTGDIVTIEEGCVPLAIVSASSANETKTSCKIHIISLFLAAILLAFAMALRKSHEKGTQILLIVGNLLLLAIAIFALVKQQCIWDFVVFGVTAVLSAVIILVTKLQERR